MEWINDMDINLKGGENVLVSSDCGKPATFYDAFIWVSIKEKLPEPGLRYLATDGECVEIMSYFGEYKGHSDWSSSNCNTLDVTHWMELPKPPQKETHCT